MQHRCERASVGCTARRGASPRRVGVARTQIRSIASLSLLMACTQEGSSGDAPGDSSTTSADASDTSDTTPSDTSSGGIPPDGDATDGDGTTGETTGSD